ncbi:MAG: patatin-like phospholipase family protein [Anaerolineae bacterium]
MVRFFRRPKVGLALSGGGARGLAHIGVLKVLEREGIPIDFLAGTSMGGVVAAGYAAGLSPEFMEQEALRMGRLRKLVGLFDLALPKAGLVEGRKIEAYLAQHLGEMTFDDLRIPLALVAVDLVTGEEVVLRSGSVIEAVRATISLPGIFAPFRKDGYLLIDGGVLNPLPADVVRHIGADVVIAVNVAIALEGLPRLLEAEEQGLPLTQIPLIIETLHRTVGIMENRISAQKLQEARPEVLIRPTIDNSITLFTGFHRAAECIAAGEEAATVALPEIKSALRPHFRPSLSRRERGA